MQAQRNWNMWGLPYTEGLWFKEKFGLPEMLEKEEERYVDGKSKY